MQTAVAEALEKLRPGEPQVYRHLAMFPLIGGFETKPSYIMLSDALGGGHARVTEVSLAGRVPELLLDNPSPQRVLLLEGDELVGARQNRVLNVTLLVGPGVKLAIPVSCVERGRWSYRSREFVSEDRMMFAQGRAEKMAHVTHSIRASGTRSSDQGAVWSSLARKLVNLDASAPTEAMSDVFAHVAGDIGEYRAAFSPVPGQTGALFAIDGRVVGLEVFDAERTLQSALGRLVGSYALDALESKQRASPAPDVEAAMAFLARTASAKGEDVPSLGLGVEVRLAAPGIVGEALVVDDHLVHLSALKAEKGDGTMEGPGSRTRNMGARRRG
jgi:hypothetical protein